MTSSSPGDRLAGRQAVVTGAANGIGRAVALRLAREGARVFLADKDGPALEPVAREIVDAGGHVEQILLDVTEPDAIRRQVGQIVSSAGQVDILVNNAGGTLSQYPLVLEADPDYFEAIFRLNVTSTFLMSRAVIGSMPSGGSIVNIASVGALVHGRGFGIYGAAKAAVVRLTKAIALDYADRGIRANAVCPGTIATAAITRMMAKTPDPEAALQSQIAGIPLNRLGEPADVASLVAFLVSDDASFLTGTVQVVDGGATR